MARVHFTPQLRRFTDTPDVDAPAATLHDALEAAFAVNPRLRGYVLDEQGDVRPNVAIFVDGRRCPPAQPLTMHLAPASAVYVMQALSGG